MRIIAKTDRLYLREFQKSDGYHFFHMNNDPKVIKYTGNTSFQSMKDAMAFIEEYKEYEHYGFGRWAVCCKSTDEFLGWCGLKFDEKFKAVDLGFRFYRKHWNQGYATESALECISYGFQQLNIDKIIGRAYLENRASIKVLKKCGLKFVRTYLYDGAEAELYQIIKNGS